MYNPASMCSPAYRCNVIPLMVVSEMVCEPVHRVVLLPDVDMSNPTSNSGKFMDKKLQALVNDPPLLLYPPLSSFITIFISIKTDITNHIYHNAT